MSQAAVERERDVILREMEEVDSQIEEVVFDRLHEVAYGGTPLARTILGPEENIKSLMADDIVKYVQTHYTAPRMVMAASGAVDHDQLANLAGDYFGNVQSGTPAGMEFEYVVRLRRRRTQHCRLPLPSPRSACTTPATSVPSPRPLLTLSSPSPHPLLALSPPSPRPLLTLSSPSPRPLLALTSPSLRPRHFRSRLWRRSLET